MVGVLFIRLGCADGSEDHLRCCLNEAFVHKLVFFFLDEACEWIYMTDQYISVIICFYPPHAGSLKHCLRSLHACTGDSHLPQGNLTCSHSAVCLFLPLYQPLFSLFLLFFPSFLFWFLLFFTFLIINVAHFPGPLSVMSNF